VRGRNSDNKLIGERLGWQPSTSLRQGLEKTYAWIESQVNAKSGKKDATPASNAPESTPALEVLHATA
jgi:GDP-D-mannose 3', 5'-epimerase